MIVLDASAIVEWLLETPVGAKVRQRVQASPTKPNVPHLTDLEVAQALRKLIRARKIDELRGLQAFDDYRDMRFVRYPHAGFLPRIWALRGNMTAYDAMYVALAEALSATLITTDGKVAAGLGHNVPIEVIRN